MPVNPDSCWRARPCSASAGTARSGRPNGHSIGGDPDHLMGPEHSGRSRVVQGVGTEVPPGLTFCLPGIPVRPEPGRATRREAAPVPAQNHPSPRHCSPQPRNGIRCSCSRRPVTPSRSGRRAGAHPHGRGNVLGPQRVVLSSGRFLCLPNSTAVPVGAPDSPEKTVRTRRFPSHPVRCGISPQCPARTGLPRPRSGSRRPDAGGAQTTSLAAPPLPHGRASGDMCPARPPAPDRSGRAGTPISHRAIAVRRRNTFCSLHAACCAPGRWISARPTGCGGTSALAFVLVAQAHSASPTDRLRRSRRQSPGRTGWRPSAQRQVTALPHRHTRFLATGSTRLTGGAFEAGSPIRLARLAPAQH